MIRKIYRYACCLFLVLSTVYAGLARGQVKAAVLKEKCAVRLSTALTGKYPSPTLEQAQDPQSMVDDILKSPDFIEYFARYFNSKANETPGSSTTEDASYHLAKHILTQGEPWKNTFTGPYDLMITGTGAAQTVAVINNPNGLGYFRNKAWLDRYAGNEPAGIKLNTVYRMMNNVVGLELVATTNAPGADISATGRQQPACKSCHYDGWFALDNNAAILSRVTRTGNTINYTPYTAGPKPVLGGLMASNDAEFIKALVESENFLFHACRLSFKFLYGRPENQCESALFDKCFDAFKASGQIQSAIATIAKDPSFCN